MKRIFSKEEIDTFSRGLSGGVEEPSVPVAGELLNFKESKLGLTRENGSETPCSNGVGIDGVSSNIKIRVVDTKEFMANFNSESDYSSLRQVLNDSYNQAAEGKGKERHANDLPFDKQPIMQIARMHGLAYLTGQAAKKLQEAHKLLEIRGSEAAEAELLGAINYTAAAVLWVREQKDKTNGG